MRQGHTGRDDSLDNVKGVLIVLVVFGHVLEPFIASRPCTGRCMPGCICFISRCS